MTDIQYQSAQKLLADNLVFLKKKHGYSEAKIAELAKLGKINAKTINNMVNQKGNPEFDNIENVASAFGLSVWQLLHPKLESVLASEIDEFLKSSLTKPEVIDARLRELIERWPLILPPHRQQLLDHARLAYTANPLKEKKTASSDEDLKTVIGDVLDHWDDMSEKGRDAIFFVVESAVGKDPKRGEDPDEVPR